MSAAASDPRAFSKMAICLCSMVSLGFSLILPSSTYPIRAKIKTSKGSESVRRNGELTRYLTRTYRLQVKIIVCIM